MKDRRLKPGWRDGIAEKIRGEKSAPSFSDEPGVARPFPHLSEDEFNEFWKESLERQKAIRDRLKILRGY